MSQTLNHGTSREASLTGVLLASIVAMMLSGAFCLMRLGMGDISLQEAGRVLGLAWLLLNGPVFISCRCLPATWQHRPLFSPGALSLIMLASLTGAGWLFRRLDVTLTLASWLPALLGGCLFCVNLLSWLLHRRVAWTVLFLIFAMALGTAVALMVYTNEFHHPLLIENLRQGQFPHNDTYFHAAAANMIDLHGVSSTGLDGLVPLRYHVGSHWILSLLADLAGIGMFQSYVLLYPVVLVSWFIFALQTLAQSYWGTRRGGRSDLLYWLILAIGTLGFLPLPVGLETYLCLNWTTTSESHAISTAILMFILSVAIKLYIAWKQESHFAASDLQALLVMIPITLALLSFTKISVPLVMLPVAVLAFWRLRLFQSRWWTMGLLLTLGLSAAICLMLVGFAAQEQKAFPLAYVFYMVPRQWWGLFFPVMLLWAGLYVWFRVNQKGIETLADLWLASRERKIVDIELLLSVLIISSAPALFYTSFAVFFFWDYQRWIGLALVLGSLGAWGLRRADETDSSSPVKPRSIRISSCFLILLLLCCLLTQGVNAWLSFKQYTLEMVQGRAATAEQAKDWTEQTNVAFRRFHVPQIFSLIRQAAASRPGPTRKMTIDILCELNKLPRAERKLALVYIPKHNRDFWDHLPAGINRLFTCFLAPSLSGMPQLDGVPEYDPAFDYYYATAWNYLGFADYHLENHRPEQKPWRSDLNDLKNRVKEKGFRVLYIIDQDEKGVFLEKVICE